MLSDVVIEQKMKVGELTIEPFERERLGKYFYRLRVGGRAIKFFKGGDIIIDLEKEGFIRIDKGEHISIETLERIVLPSNIRGHLVRSEQLEAGLNIIEAFVEPGFEGRPQITLINWRPLHTYLEFGDELCSIVFEEVEQVLR